jgi:hypothetical protein
MEGFPLYDPTCITYNTQKASAATAQLSSVGVSTTTTSTVYLDSAMQTQCVDHRNVYNVPAFLDASYPLELGQLINDFAANSRYVCMYICMQE